MIPTVTSKGTPRRNFRVPDALWLAAQRKAEETETTVTKFIVKALREWVGWPPEEPPTQRPEPPPV